MHTLRDDLVEVTVPTQITKVDDDTAAISFFFGENRTDLRFERIPAITSIAQWHDEMSVDPEPVSRTVYLSAVASSDVIGGGRITIQQVRISENHFEEPWPLPVLPQATV